MPNPKCPICKCYIPEPVKKSSGEIFKTCERCRVLQKKQRDKDKVKNTDTDIEIKKENDKKYANIEDMPDENIVIPYECCNEIE